MESVSAGIIVGTRAKDSARGVVSAPSAENLVKVFSSLNIHYAIGKERVLSNIDAKSL